MACVKGINLSKDNSKGECGNKGGKCDLVYEYGINTCTVSNQTTYLELIGCGNKAFLSFGGNELTIGLGNLRIYSKPIHNIIDGSDDNTSNNIVAEAILHYTDINKKDVLICIPIKKDDTSGDDFWSFLNTVSPQGTKTPAAINTSNFTLNNLVTNCPFFQYSGIFPYDISGVVGGACKSTANIIVLDPTDGNIATISTKHWNTLNTLITPWTTTSTTISAPSDLFYNSHGAKKPGDDPNESKVRILSKCVETSNVAPPDSKKKTIKAYLWIVPTAMLLLLVVMALIYWIYTVTKGNVFSTGTAVGGVVSGASSSVASSISSNKGITVLSIGLLICIVFIVILSVRSYE